ncbi:hypothetical protein QYE76_063868 [Lolium multiflorum]|uniref:CCHC-type domain-containing protein n=1 Tax=Lolium multiflorum TaxID=4521 RepID=A0AAD8S7A8_LOLMU|nr:hypothetical protein QYE76_063868 [Lolium multiflorum]
MENNLEVAGVEAEKNLFATHYLSGPASLVDKCPRNECGTDDDLGRLQVEVQQIPCAPRTDQEDERRIPGTQTRKDVHGGIQRVLLCQWTQPYRWKEGCIRANENQAQNDEPEWTHHTPKYRNNSWRIHPRYNKPPTQSYRPNYTNNDGGPPKPGGNNNNNSHNNNSHNNNNHHNSNNNNGNNNNNTNTAPRTGSNATPIIPKDKATINCYECGVVGHYSNECPKKLAKIAANTAAPAQQQRRFAGRRNQNNNNGRLYHMNATEAREASQTMPSMSSC